MQPPNHDLWKPQLVKEAKHFTTNILPPRFFMVHDARRRCQHNVAKLHILTTPKNNVNLVLSYFGHPDSLTR